MAGRRIWLTLHAEDVLEEREIPREWVQRVVNEPTLVLRDRHDTELEHALAPIPERDGRILRVVYNAGIEPFRVITAYFDRRMRGRL